MSETSRRTFVKQCLAAAAAWQAGRAISLASPGKSIAFELEVLGKVKRRRASSIAASKLSVGFETLDREMFDPRPTYRMLAELGVKWARVQTGWSRTERTKGKYDFAWLDEVVDSLMAAGVQPWFSVSYGNQFYSPDAPDVSAVGWAPLATEEARQAWTSYVSALAEHFGGRVKHWEIWNEPNIRKFWLPGPSDPKAYVELVALTAPLVRQQVAEAVIIGGALAGIPLDYVEGCMDAGLGEHVDKISYHPYRAVPEADYDEELSALGKLLDRYKPGLGLWQGECGCPSEPGSSGALGGFHWSEPAQAKWLLRRILTDLRLEVELTSYFHTVDLVNYNWGLGPSGKTNFKGLLRGTDYSPKPSFFTYQCLAALFDGETKRAELDVSIEVPEDGDPLLAEDLVQQAGFVRQGRAIFAYWLPASLLADFETRKIGISIAAEGEAELNDPVLIDPLTQEVLAIPAEESEGVWKFGSVPLVEYPLILTDRAIALPETETPEVEAEATEEKAAEA